MAMGHWPRRSLLILWAWTAVLSGVVLVPSFTNQGNAIVPFLVAGLGVLLYTFFHPMVRQPPPVGVFDQEAPWTPPPVERLPRPPTVARKREAGAPPPASSTTRHLRPPRSVP